MRGLLAILFGLAAFFLSGITFASLISLFGFYALVDGTLAIIAAARMAGRGERWWLLLEGATGVSVGALILVWPGLTTPALLYCIAAWAAVTGFFEIVGAARLRREIKGEWALTFGGLASMVFGFVLAMMPGVGLLSLLWLVGSYALVFGALLTTLALRVQSRQTPGRGLGSWLRPRRKRASGSSRGRSRGERTPRVVRRRSEDPAGRRGSEDSVRRDGEDTIRWGNEDPADRGNEAPVSRCQRIKSNGERCKGRAVRGSDWCPVHHPDYQEKRRQSAARKKKAGNRGRLPSSSDLNEVQDLIRSTLLGVYQGKIERSVGMAMFQGCGVLLQTIETQKKLVEMEEDMARIEAQLDGQEGGKKRRLG